MLSWSKLFSSVPCKKLSVQEKTNIWNNDDFLNVGP